ncbi:hypothetical protein Q9233_014833 [Columba guinea]|nr:hypothetical protein Q9233_014833 [Columba guinea]
MQEVSAEPELCAVPPEPPAASCPHSEDSEKSIPLAVHEIINQALEKLEEMQVPMPDYALKSAGAAVIQSRTSPSLRTAKAKVFWYSLPVMDYMRSPELILEPDNHPGNCWPFPGSQGHMFIKLSMPVIPRAVTMAHVSGTAFHGESISGAPKDFAVYGSKEEHEEQGTFLGQFTFLATRNPSQTFQLKAVHEIVNQALEKLEEMQVPMPDYALKSAGAAVIQSRTSPSLRTAKAKVFWYSLPVMDYMRSPELILETDNHPGNCWPFPGSQGHMFIKLSMPVIPRAVTMAHVSGTAFHGESISGAPKDFAVYGSKEEHEEQGTFLGQFTFLATRNPSQTFQLKGVEQDKNVWTTTGQKPPRGSRKEAAHRGRRCVISCIWDAESGMLNLRRCIWDAVFRMPYQGCRIWAAISGMPYPGCCIYDVLSGIL